MSEKRFTIETFCDGDTEYKCLFDNKNEKEIISDDGFWFEERYSDVVELLNEQQATIKEYKENWDDMVELATKTSLRNVELDEQIGRLQRENEQLRRLFVEMKQPITINLTEEDEKELRKLLGLIDDE